MALNGFVGDRASIVSARFHRTKRSASNGENARRSPGRSRCQSLSRTPASMWKKFPVASARSPASPHRSPHSSAGQPVVHEVRGTRHELADFERLIWLRGAQPAPRLRGVPVLHNGGSRQIARPPMRPAASATLTQEACVHRRAPGPDGHWPTPPIPASGPRTTASRSRTRPAARIDFTSRSSMPRRVRRQVVAESFENRRSDARSRPVKSPTSSTAVDFAPSPSPPVRQRHRLTRRHRRPSSQARNRRGRAAASTRSGHGRRRSRPPTASGHVDPRRHRSFNSCIPGEIVTATVAPSNSTRGTTRIPDRRLRSAVVKRTT
jgi:hypothetical protein